MKDELKLFNTRINVGPDALVKLDNYIKKNFSGQSKIILADENTKVKCLPLLLKNCKTLKNPLFMEVNSGEQYKNVIGTYASPGGVFVWKGFLETLNERNIKCGFAEMIKHALIANKKLWKKFSHAELKECISDKNILSAIKIKTNIVRKDPFE